MSLINSATRIKLLNSSVHDLVGVIGACQEPPLFLRPLSALQFYSGCATHRSSIFVSGDKPSNPANHVEGLIPGCTLSDPSMPATSGPFLNCGTIIRASLNPDGTSLCNPISRLNPDDARLYRTPNVAQYLTLLDTCSVRVLLKRQRRPRNWIVTIT
jgi:hypothetical protein